MASRIGPLLLSCRFERPERHWPDAEGIANIVDESRGDNVYFTLLAQSVFEIGGSLAPLVRPTADRTLTPAQSGQGVAAT